jgi:hypothetical protein
MERDKDTHKAAWILAAIAAIEGTWVVLNVAVNGAGFWRYVGFAPNRAGNWAGWILAAIVTATFVRGAMRLPSVRANLFRSSWLKVLALLVAVSAGILEEVVFRKWLMDAVQARGYGDVIQIVLSAAAFGFAHGIWGLFGRSVRAASGATIATGLLGGALAIVYVAAGRSLAPCIAAHMLINVFIEPGLMLAATRGEMNRPRHASPG